MITVCSHCDLPLDAPSPAPAFCCVGCEAAYTAIHEAGLTEFYRIRGIVPGSERPATDASDGQFARFDTAEFIESQTLEIGDGLREVELCVDGVHCGGCAWLIERMPHHIGGVVDARLDLPRARLRLRFAPDSDTLSSAARWLSRFGYAAHPLRRDGGNEATALERQHLLKVGISWALAANVMLFAVSLYSGLDVDADSALRSLFHWLSFALTGISIAYGGRTFFTRAWLSLTSRPYALSRLSMDVPISLGIGVGFLYSIWATITQTGDVWFDSIAVLIAALLTARWLQIRGRRVAGDAADRLVSLLPSNARRVDDDGTVEIPAEQLEVDDLVRVLAGETVPADGVITDGISAVSRAIITGESAPEAAKAGDTLQAGVVNLESPLVLRVSATGADTRVGRLLKWVEDRAASRAPIVQLADRIGGIFVLIVILAALVTGIVWAVVASPGVAVSHVVALLVVSCPCALGMATPLSLTVATGRAASRGIFIKHDDVLERLPKLTRIVFDKTGTLTEGRMSVVNVQGDESAARLAGALEANSGHPVARAIVQWAAAAGTATDVVESPGQGIEGVVEGKRVRVGRPDWFADASLSNLPDMAAHAARQGATPVAVEVDGELVALISLADELRPEACHVLDWFRRRGVVPMLLSGDHPGAVSHAAERLGIAPQHVRGGVSPEAKLALIEQLAASGEAVAMIGDGVNDAAAIQAADIGIAVQGGAEVSVVAADIFITRPGVEPLFEAVDIAETSRRVIRRTLFASAAYNVIAVSLAAAGLISPLAAAVAMPLSSIAVVLSALYQRHPRRSSNMASGGANNARAPLHRPEANDGFTPLETTSPPLVPAGTEVAQVNPL